MPSVSYFQFFFQNIFFQNIFQFLNFIFLFASLPEEVDICQRKRVTKLTNSVSKECHHSTCDILNKNNLEISLMFCFAPHFFLQTLRSVL